MQEGVSQEGMGLLMVLGAIGRHAPQEACSGCAARAVEGEAGPHEATEAGLRSLRLSAQSQTLPSSVCLQWPLLTGLWCQRLGWGGNMYRAHS